MKRFSLALSLAFALLPGCANRPDDASRAATSSPEPESPGSGQADVAESMATTPAVSIELERQLHARGMTEVVLDPSGRAALTLDADGGVRLWPDVHAEQMDEPLALPVHEPVWMSLASTEHGFVAGFIDTAGGAVVGRIRIEGDRARWQTTFELPITDPMFELHVLAGGERILGLGHDHQIRVWNAEGKELSRIDEPGFVPWQLRVAQPAGAAPRVLAVLSGPLRVQPITLTNDRLRLEGSAHPITVDRGPNRNDVALSPDGTTLLALRRTERRSKRFELELLDLSSGQRRILATELDTRDRPRLHPWDATRALLETGNGDASWIDLQATVEMPAQRDETFAPPTVPRKAVQLAATEDDRRMHAVVVAGHRFVPTPAGLVVDPVQSDGHRVLGRAAFDPTGVALDVTGSRVAWGSKTGVLLEAVGGGTSSKPLAAEHGTRPLGFVGDALVSMGPDGRVALVQVDDGSITGTEAMAVSWGIGAVGWRPQERGGQVVLSSINPRDPVHVLSVTPEGFGEVQDIPRSEQHDWPEAGKPRGMASRTWLERLGVSLESKQFRPAQVLTIEPDPSGRRLAMVQRFENRSFDPSFEETVVTHGRVLTVWDAQTSRRLWTMEASDLTDFAWSGDGERLAVATSNLGLVLDAQTGKTLLERRDRGLEVTSVAR